MARTDASARSAARKAEPEAKALSKSPPVPLVDERQDGVGRDRTARVEESVHRFVDRAVAANCDDFVMAFT